MALKIFKRGTATPQPTPPPAPAARTEKKLVLKSKVVNAPAPAPAPVSQHLADVWKSWPISPTLEHFQQHKDTHRPPDPRPCTACGAAYPFPCDGAKDSKCITAIAIREGKFTPLNA